MMYHDNPNRATPENWNTESYTVRRQGCTAWEQDILTFNEAKEAQKQANQIAGYGHQIIAEQWWGDDRRSVLVAEHE